MIPVRSEAPAVPKNWGRFGPDDQLGTVNFLTPEAVLRGVACVRSGTRHPLNLPVDQPAGLGHGRPEFSRTAFARNVNVEGLIVNDDYATLALQGSSQWDALVHAGAQEPSGTGVFYNGYGFDAVDESGHAEKLSIANLAQVGIAGRGILLDVARLVSGTSAPLPSDFLIDDALIRRCQAETGVEPVEGDIVCIRTGWTGAYLRGDSDERARMMTPIDGSLQCPGIVPEVAHLAHEQGWAALAADNLAVEAMPPRSGWGASAHVTMLRNLGLPFGELLWFDELAACAAEDGRYDFLFVAVPLLIPGAMGSPSCAMAIR